MVETNMEQITKTNCDKKTNDEYNINEFIKKSIQLDAQLLSTMRLINQSIISIKQLLKNIDYQIYRNL